MARNDYRVLLTQRMFKTAFLKLLRVKPVQNITVRELCEEAGVNRGTFYSHYEDIYDLLHKIEMEMFNELVVIAQKLAQNTSSLNDFYVELCKFLKANSDVCAMLLSPNGDSSFLYTIVQYGEQIFMELYRSKYSADKEKYLTYYYKFIAGGCISLCRAWLQNDFSDSVEDMSSMLKMIIEKGLKVEND